MTRLESTRECAAVTDMDFKNWIFRRLEIAAARVLSARGTGKKEKGDVVFICVVVRSVCGDDIDTGKSGHRGGELQPGDRYQDSGRGGHGVGMVVINIAQGGIWEISMKCWIILIM